MRPLSGASIGALLRARRGNFGPVPVILGIAAIWLVFHLMTGNFVSARNLSNLSVQLTVIIFLALGEFIVLLSGQIDLSMGSVLGASAALLAVLLQAGLPAWAAIVLTLAFGAVIGLVQGAISAYLDVPSFIVTLGGFLGILGLAFLLVGSSGEIAIYDPVILAIVNDYLPAPAAWAIFGVVVLTSFLHQLAERRSWARAGEADRPTWRKIIARTLALAIVLGTIVGMFNSYIGISYVVAFVALFVLVLGWIVRSTPFGRYIFAIGGNEPAAERAGIPTRRVKTVALVISGLFAAIAGIVSASLVFAVSSATGGGTLLLEAIAAVVIGGTSLHGGYGRIYQPVLGAVVITSIENGLGLLGKGVALTYIVTGVILTVAVAVDSITRRRR